MRRGKEEALSEALACRYQAGGQVPGGVVCLTKTQMAAALQISVRSLNAMMARGDVAFFRLGPRLVRFQVEEALKRMSERVLVAAEGEE